jgi:MFS family permease
VSSATAVPEHAWGRRSWRDASIRFAVGLAFADASIVVLALPQIVGQFDTTISRVTWVIMAYNIALIAVVAAFLPFASRLGSRHVLLAGIALFGAASIGCAIADGMPMLVTMRALQGAGGALLLCASLPLLAGAARPGSSPTGEWAAAAAIGAAIGPAAGGLLTEVFDWRAIFVAQAPAAAIAAAAVLAVPAGSFRAVAEERHERSELGPGAANVALLLLSAGLIGALFLVVVLLIDVWQLSPAAAAAVVSAIPIATFAVERAARGRSPLLTGIGGALLLAAGLAVIGLVTHQQVAVVALALAVCGAGLGLAFTTLTAAAMSGSGSTTTRAGRTVGAREAGLVLGLLVLTPIFVDDLDKAPGRALPPVVVALSAAPVDDGVKTELGVRLLAAYRDTPEGRLPDLDPAFDAVSARLPAAGRAQLDTLQARIQSTIERQVTRSFRRSLLFCALFALSVIPVLLLHVWWVRRTPAARPGGSPGDAAG